MSASSETTPEPAGSGTIGFASADFGRFIVASGLSGPEQRTHGLEGRWTDGPAAKLAFVLPPNVRDDVLITLDLVPFLWGDALPEQVVEIRAGGSPVANWVLLDPLPRRRVIFVERAQISASNVVELDFALPNCTSPHSLGVNEDKRALGIKLQRLVWQAVRGRPPPHALFWQLGRPVGGEARKTFDEKVATGFWAHFIRGPRVLDIGYKGYAAIRGVVPILDGAIGVDMDYPGYDGRTLPFGDGTQDAVYSSHCLEHIPDYLKAIQEWHRVTRVGGHVITVVPSAQLYERGRRPPSRQNDTHIRFYTPGSLLAEFETALGENSYRVRHLRENDQGYRYDLPPEVHPTGCYEIELVIEKIAPPSWKLAE